MKCIQQQGCLKMWKRAVRPSFYLFWDSYFNSTLQDAFTSEEMVKRLLKNVEAVLKPGGFFFGTAPDSSTIWYSTRVYTWKYSPSFSYWWTALGCRLQMFCLSMLLLSSPDNVRFIIAMLFRHSQCLSSLSSHEWLFWVQVQVPKGCARGYESRLVESERNFTGRAHRSIQDQLWWWQVCFYGLLLPFLENLFFRNCEVWMLEILGDKAILACVCRFLPFGSKYHIRFTDDGLPPQSQLLVHFPSLIR